MVMGINCYLDKHQVLGINSGQGSVVSEVPVWCVGPDHGSRSLGACGTQSARMSPRSHGVDPVSVSP